MTTIVAEFKAFLLKQNALALAIGVIIGAAIGKVVSGVTDDLIMPVVGVLLPGAEWRNAQLTLTGNNAIKFGDFLGRVVDFAIVAAVVFAIVKIFIKEEAKPPPPAVKICPYCLEEIPQAATRCRACTSTV
jgi:large conductance mechanosensitive channel